MQEAVDQLLEIFRRDREWNDGAAKAQLFHDLRRAAAQGPDRAGGPAANLVAHLCLTREGRVGAR